VPPAGRFLWDWYFDLSESLRRVRAGLCEPIPPSEFLAWREATGNIVYPSEYAILREMDTAYCDEMNKELADFQERQREAQAAEIPKARPTRGKRR
jgi:hypothetical protein